MKDVQPPIAGLAAYDAVQTTSNIPSVEPSSEALIIVREVFSDEYIAILSLLKLYKKPRICSVVHINIIEI